MCKQTVLEGGNPFKLNSLPNNSHMKKSQMQQEKSRPTPPSPFTKKIYRLLALYAHARKIINIKTRFFATDTHYYVLDGFYN